MALGVGMFENIMEFKNTSYKGELQSRIVNFHNFERKYLNLKMLQFMVSIFRKVSITVIC